jgi:hypothetical protein
MTGAGPLIGLKVVEIGAIGPVTHAMMMLADLVADVVRVARPAGTDGALSEDLQDTALRGRRQLTADLKSDEGRQLVLDLATLPTCWLPRRRLLQEPSSASRFPCLQDQSKRRHGDRPDGVLDCQLLHPGTERALTGAAATQAGGPFRQSSNGKRCVSPASSCISKTVSNAAVLAYIPARDMRSISSGTPSSETAAS